MFKMLCCLTHVQDPGAHLSNMHHKKCNLLYKIIPTPADCDTCNHQNKHYTCSQYARELESPVGLYLQIVNHSDLGIVRLPPFVM